MTSPPVGARLAVFLAILLVVVGGSVAFGVASVPTPGDTAVDYPEASGLVPEQVAATDDAETVRTDERHVVVVDDAHGNRPLESEYDPFVAAFGPNTEVRFLADESQIRESLAGADAFLVADPSIAFTSDETDAVEAFVEDGGRLVVLGEPTRYRVAGPVGSPLPVRSRVDTLAGRFGIAFGTGYLYDQSANDGNFKRVLADGEGLLADRRVALYTAAAVRSSGGSTLLSTAETTRSSDTSAVGSRTVAVRDGNVLAVGDTTFLEGEKDLVADNERLVETIARFAVSGDRERSLTEYPYLMARDAQVRYTGPALLNASKTAANDLRDGGFDPSLTLGAAGANDTDLLVATYDDLGPGTAWTDISAEGSQVSVPGYRGARSNTTLVYNPEGTDSVVVVGPDPRAIERAVTVLVEDEMREEAISDRTVVLRNATNTSVGGGSAGDDGDGSDGSGADDPTGPAAGPSLAPRAPVR